MPWYLVGGFWALPSLWAGFNIGQELPEKPKNAQDRFFDAVDYRTWLLGGVAIYIYLNKDKKRIKTTKTEGWRTTGSRLYKAYKY